MVKVRNMIAILVGTALLGAVCSVYVLVILCTIAGPRKGARPDWCSPGSRRDGWPRRAP